MSGIGPFEFVFIAIIALIVIGPEKFPDFAKVVMRSIRDLKTYVDETKRELTQVGRDLSREIDPVRRELDDFTRKNPDKAVDALSKSLFGEEDESSGEGKKIESGEAAAGAEAAPEAQQQEEADRVTYGSMPKADAPGEPVSEPAEPGTSPSQSPGAGEDQGAASSPPEDQEPGERKEPSYFPERMDG